MNNINYLTIFNEHFIEFVDDIINVFPDDIDIKTAKNGFLMFRKSNPKLIVNIFKTHILDKYGEYIDNGDIEFFINKDYKDDINIKGKTDKIIEAIDRLREPIRLMDNSNKEKVIKYLQNLKKISELYFMDNN